MLTDSMIAMIAERLRQSSHEFRVLEEAHHRLDLGIDPIAETPRADSGRRADP